MPVEPSWTPLSKEPLDLKTDGVWLYWLNTNFIARMRVDGTGLNEEWIAVPGALALGLDETYLYWAGTAKFAVGRSKLDGSSQEPEWLTNGEGFGSVQSIAPSATHLYMARGSGVIDRATIAGTELAEGWLEPEGLAEYVAVDATHLYYSHRGKPIIGRVTLEGEAPEPEYIVASGGIWTFTLHEGDVYWAAFGTAIGRFHAGTVENSFLTPPGEVELGGGVVLVGGDMYWTSDNPASIGRSGEGEGGGEEHHEEVPTTLTPGAAQRGVLDS